TILPMMFIDDAVRATIEIMEAPKNSIQERTSYNVTGISFSPLELYQQIIALYPDFKISYRPDFRQKIAENWPCSLDDQAARNDWGWIPQYDIKKLTRVMINQLEKKYRLKNKYI
ncbi:MAG: NAD-dependent epimerase, partial [Flavobacteriaceae bacterium]|nr:NAD-dependent epimerase [Flavobacteriaceae bacterium]